MTTETGTATEQDHFYETQKGQEDDIKQLRADLAQEQQANAALLGWFQEFRALVCKAAWAIVFPGQNITGFAGDEGTRHCHDMLAGDALAAFADLAALDPSGYAPASKGCLSICHHAADEPCGPQCAAPAPYFAADGGNRPEHSVGAGPRRELPPGAMHQGPSGLPSTGARRS